MEKIILEGLRCVLPVCVCVWLHNIYIHAHLLHFVYGRLQPLVAGASFRVIDEPFSLAVSGGNKDGVIG